MADPALLLHRVAVAEFGEADRLVAAALRVREMGYAAVEAYAPFPIPALEDALGLRRTRIPFGVFAAGAAGAGAAYFVLWWTNAVDYRLDVGGRPYDSIPTYVPIVFEVAVLFAAFAAFVLALVRSGLPRLYDPVFEIQGFERTSIDRFWLTIGDAALAEGDAAGAERLVHALRELGALSVRLPARSDEGEGR